MVSAGQLLPVLGIAMQAGAAVIFLIWFVLPRLQGKFGRHGGIPGPAFWLPLIGETPQLLQSPFKYMWNRWLLYGAVFRTNILGQKVYVVGEAEALRPVWSDESSFEFFVSNALFRMSGFIHRARSGSEGLPRFGLRGKGCFSC